MTSTDLLLHLPPIDRLEGFWPGGFGMYRWMLIAARCGHVVVPAWTYDGSSLTDFGAR